MDEGGNWVDGTAIQRTGWEFIDQIHHLAKVRVVGSNPVFRSIGPVQKQFIKFCVECPLFGIWLGLNAIPVSGSAWFERPTGCFVIG